jgi:hypothetical protein
MATRKFFIWLAVSLITMSTLACSISGFGIDFSTDAEPADAAPMAGSWTPLGGAQPTQPGAESAGGGYWWPSNRVNPEANPIRQGLEGNWEDLEGNWRLPDGTDYFGIRKVDSNGQKYGIWLDTGPYGLTGPEVLRLLVPNEKDQKLVIRVTPEGPRSGGWWTVETLKPGATESLVPGYLVPAGGATVTFSTAPGGMFDYWHGFAAPTPRDACQVDRLQDADSGLDAWRITCQPGESATFKSDGVTWNPPTK